MKWSLKFLQLGEKDMAQLERDLDADFVAVTLLDPADNTVKTGRYYCSSVNHGVQRYIGGETVYDGVSVNLIER